MRNAACGAAMTLLLALPHIGAAQTPPAGNQWNHATELGVLGGFTTASVGDGGTLAGTAAWQVNPWIAIEGRGTWIDRGVGANAFAADLSGLLNLGRKSSVTPFVGAGYGLYRASFDSTGQAMPGFYRRRLLDGSTFAVNAVAFTDPATRLTAGVDILTRRHLTIRPEASVLLVRSGGETNTMVTVGVRLGYRFEDHPITPSR